MRFLRSLHSVEMGKFLVYQQPERTLISPFYWSNSLISSIKISPYCLIFIPNAFYF
ncbi:hypothetical protein ANHYDRO_01354 [Anaerococcus hydrogenalis DSM 7454]|uniref:Uncharacterized protein n=1 Tax=Anaerococcus hydrogenalis DSM 7454 TaxID=561177 RepID=B6W9S9_9FIRM|nr:hypothetical protein ANHYDRO_01354 [Anaerococcus hydrogenalis DSM 7454]